MYRKFAAFEKTPLTSWWRFIRVMFWLVGFSGGKPAAEELARLQKQSEAHETAHQGSSVRHEFRIRWQLRRDVSDLMTKIEESPKKAVDISPNEHSEDLHVKIGRGEDDIGLQRCVLTRISRKLSKGFSFGLNSFSPNDCDEPSDKPA